MVSPPSPGSSARPGSRARSRTLGPSYLGLTQWAIAADAGPELKAMAPQITASEFRNLTYSGESIGLDTGLTWIQQMAHQEDEFFAQLQNRRGVARQLRAAFRHLPLREVDTLATGHRCRISRIGWPITRRGIRGGSRWISAARSPP